MSIPTQIQYARDGVVTDQMRAVADDEHTDAEVVRQKVASGLVVIPANHAHASLRPKGVGEGLSTKVNVNLGSSGDAHDVAGERHKAELVDRLGADAIMDLTNCGKTTAFRRHLVKTSHAMIGTVPVYDAVGRLGKRLQDLTSDDFLEVLKAHAADGVDFVTVHAGLTNAVVQTWLSCTRTMNIVSRGGSLMFAWMRMTGNENPFFERFDDVCDILRAHDVTLSLGDAMRPGCLDDATDQAQVAELVCLGGLVDRAREAGVQVMVEGPGHIPIDQVAANVKAEKSICHGAPFYMLGPLVCDVGAGYDHITAAIGGAVAGAAGADFLCDATPAEHLRLPDEKDVRDGLVASKIAAHAADVAKGVPGAKERDHQMALARHSFDWDRMFELAIDGEEARRRYESAPPSEEGTCSMCGSMCAVKTVDDALKGLGLSI